jgi:hypothetical protein
VDSSATNTRYRRRCCAELDHRRRVKQLVWRGAGTDTLSDKPETNSAKLNKALAKMFEQYPPTQK